jgi:hypothetical protein
MRLPCELPFDISQVIAEVTAAQARMLEQGHACGKIAINGREIQQDQRYFPRARLALLIRVIHCVKCPVVAFPLGCAVAPGL